MHRRRIAILCAASIACAACSLLLGIDGEVVDPLVEGGAIDAGPPVLVVDMLQGPLFQGGTIDLHVTRAAGAVGNSANLKLDGFPEGGGVAAKPFDPRIKEGETRIITLVAEANAAIREVELTLTGSDFGDTQLKVPLSVTGNLDTDFGDSGIAIIPFAGRPTATGNFGLTVDPVSDEIYVAFARDDLDLGPTTAAVARCLPNGTVDTVSFGTKGFVDVDGGFAAAQGRAVFFDADAGLVVFGDGRPGIPPATPFTFAHPSRQVSKFVATPPFAAEATTMNVAIQAGGGFIALATRTAVDNTPPVPPLLFRADRRGAFAADGGYLLIPGMLEGADVAVADGGKMLVFGAAQVSESSSDTMVVRLLADGGADPSFGDGGVARTNDPRDNTIHAGAIEAAGTLLFAGDIAADIREDAGENTLMRLGRFDDLGRLDLTFGNGGTVAIGGPDPLRPGARANAVIPLADGRFLVTGALENLDDLATDKRVVVARFLRSGAIDTAFGWQGFSRVTLPVSEGRRMAWQKNMVIVAALFTTPDGRSNIALMRYRP